MQEVTLDGMARTCALVNIYGGCIRRYGSTRRTWVADRKRILRRRALGYRAHFSRIVVAIDAYNTIEEAVNRRDVQRATVISRDVRWRPGSSRKGEWLTGSPDRQVRSRRANRNLRDISDDSGCGGRTYPLGACGYRRGS